MRTYRCVHAACETAFQWSIGADDLLVELLTHAVQSLELKPAGTDRGHDFAYVRHGVSIMCRELRIEHVQVFGQQARAGQVGDVGVDLAGEDGETREATLLRTLDLGVPV